MSRRVVVGHADVEPLVADAELTQLVGPRAQQRALKPGGLMRRARRVGEEGLVGVLLSQGLMVGQVCLTGRRGGRCWTSRCISWPRGDPNRPRATAA